eukprot:2109589-Alexandrium_andersonii.AAC.1
MVMVMTVMLVIVMMVVVVKTIVIMMVKNMTVVAMATSPNRARARSLELSEAAPLWPNSAAK